MQEDNLILDEPLFEGQEWRPVHASRGQRFVNYLLDQVAMTGMMSAFVLFSGLIEALSDTLMSNWIVGAIAGLIYYTLMESFLQGKSLGKYVTKTRVVTHEGYQPELSTILVRSLCRAVPFDALSFLFKEPGGWHDEWSKTYVVQDDCLRSNSSPIETL
jgi:uncharacterized RDD family membrane protein YckC